MANVSMSRRHMAAALSALALPGIGWADQQEPTPPSSAPTRVLDGARRLTVQVFLNGQGPYPFLVDTGASASVISTTLANSLDLPPGPDVTLHGIAGAQRVQTVALDSIRVSRRERKHLNLSVLPDHYLNAPGILGMDWLGEQGLTLDVAGKQLHVGASLPKTDELSVTVPTKLRRGGLGLIEALAAGVPTLAFLDTGSTTTVGNKALMDIAIQRRGVTSAWTDLQLVSLTGQTLDGRLAALKRLKLGPISLINLPVVFGPVHTFDYWGISDRPALLLGMDVLNIFETVSLDYRRGAVHFQLSRSSVDSAMS